MQKNKVGNYSTFFLWLLKNPNYKFDRNGKFLELSNSGEWLHKVEENRNGYNRIFFNFLGHRFQVMEHIAYFIYKTGVWPDKNEQINHKDLNRQNNHIDNLELLSQSENLKYAYFARRNGFKGGKR